MHSDCSGARRDLDARSHTQNDSGPQMGSHAPIGRADRAALVGCGARRSSTLHAGRTLPCVSCMSLLASLESFLWVDANRTAMPTMCGFANAGNVTGRVRVGRKLSSMSVSLSFRFLCSSYNISSYIHSELYRCELRNGQDTSAPRQTRSFRSCQIG
eukprot:7647041-Pyramimonas_sp.AAC.1